MGLLYTIQKRYKPFQYRSELFYIPIVVHEQTCDYDHCDCTQRIMSNKTKQKRMIATDMK